MTREDKGRLFSIVVPLFTLSPYSARLCAPCGFVIMKLKIKGQGRRPQVTKLKSKFNLNLG